MTEHEKLKALMNELELNFHDIARITDHSYQSVKTMLQPNKELPRWVRLVIYVYFRKPWVTSPNDSVCDCEEETCQYIKGKCKNYQYR